METYEDPMSTATMPCLDEDLEDFSFCTVYEWKFQVGLAFGAGIIIILWILCLFFCCCSCLLYRRKKNRTYHIKETKSSGEDMDLGFQSIIPIDPEDPNDIEKITRFEEVEDNVKTHDPMKQEDTKTESTKQDNDGSKSDELETITIPSVPSALPTEDNDKEAIAPINAPEKEIKCVKFDIPKLNVKSTTSATPASILAVPSFTSNAENKIEPATVNPTTPQLFPDSQTQKVVSEISNVPKNQAESEKIPSHVDKTPSQQDDLKKNAVLSIESHTALPLPEAPLVVGEKKNDSLENMFKDILEFSTSQSLDTEAEIIQL